MTDDNNLMLEILKNMQAKFSRFEDQLNDFSTALLTLRIDVSAVRRDIQSAREEVLEAMRDNRRLRTEVEQIKSHLDLDGNPLNA